VSGAGGWRETTTDDDDFSVTTATGTSPQLPLETRIELLEGVLSRLAERRTAEGRVATEKADTAHESSTEASPNCRTRENVTIRVMGGSQDPARSTRPDGNAGENCKSSSTAPVSLTVTGKTA
jgi:hypothetical protein